MVKENMRKFEFLRLMTEKYKNSKLKNLTYSDLKMQEYLELKSINKKQAIVLFKFRVRMSPLGKTTRLDNKQQFVLFVLYTWTHKKKVSTVLN